MNGWCFVEASISCLSVRSWRSESGSIVSPLRLASKEGGQLNPEFGLPCGFAPARPGPVEQLWAHDLRLTETSSQAPAMNRSRRFHYRNHLWLCGGTGTFCRLARSTSCATSIESVCTKNCRLRTTWAPACCGAWRPRQSDSRLDQSLIRQASQFARHPNIILSTRNVSV